MYQSPNMVKKMRPDEVIANVAQALAEYDNQLSVDAGSFDAA